MLFLILAACTTTTTENTPPPAAPAAPAAAAPAAPAAPTLPGEAPAPPPVVARESTRAAGTAHCSDGFDQVFSCQGLDGNPLLVCSMLAASRAVVQVTVNGKTVDVNADKAPVRFQDLHLDGDDSQIFAVTDPKTKNVYVFMETRTLSDHYANVNVQARGALPGTDYRCQGLPVVNWEPVQVYKE